MNKEFLANLIFIFHILVVLFVIIVPFTDSPAFLILHVVFCFCLLVHWFTNSDNCSLTLLESKLRGKEVCETFTYQFIAPIYNISQKEFNEVVKIVTIILMCISIYKLTKTKKIKKSMDCLKKIKFEKNLTLLEKINLYALCLKSLF